MKFPSKIDGWLIPIMVISFVGILIALIAVMVTASPWLVRVVTVVILVFVIFLLFSVFRGTYYEVGEQALRVVSGPFRWTIPLDQITDITPTRNPLSSPALSLDRLKISYGKRKFVLISPANKDGFITALERARALHE